MAIDVQSDPRQDTLIEELRRLQKTPEEVARLLANAPRFDYEQWCRESPPATPEELADMEAFLQERETERQRSIEQEMGTLAE